MREGQSLSPAESRRKRPPEHRGPFSFIRRAGAEWCPWVDHQIANGTGDTGDSENYTHESPAVTVSLAVTTAQNTSGAGTDTVSTFENLNGSAFADTPAGSSSANRISGAGETPPRDLRGPFVCPSAWADPRRWSAEASWAHV